EPSRTAPPPVPPAPEAEAASTALPPQDAPRVVAPQPPLPPVPSLLPPVPQLAVVPPPELAAPPTQQASAAIPAWIRNAVAAPARNGRPRIAVVIDDLGLDRARSARAIALPAPLTLAFLPYATDLGSQTEAARKAGHELLVHVPMEPIGKNNDAGPSPLEIGMSSAAVVQRLRWDLSRFEGYVGIDNHMGSRFTADAEALQPVMQELRDRGLLFLDSRTVPHSAGLPVAARYGVPHAGRDVFLDDEISSPAIAAQLAELERVARHGGSAIAIGHPHDATLDALKTWLRDAPAKGFVLVPVSAIVKERGGEG
ncbi:MAG: divergent polysaccharide deacetylase family protein, partial [Stellaceae bacterium]